MHMALLCLPLHPLLKKILKVYNLKKQNKTLTYLRNAVFSNVKQCRTCLKRFKTLFKHYLCISDSIKGMNIFDVHIVCTYV